MRLFISICSHNEVVFLFLVYLLHELCFVLCVVYDGKGTLEEGETAESRFIKIQAAYELLMDTEKRRQYDTDNRVNPMKASQAWMEWLMKKRKAFDQRGDMAIAAWAEQQQLEINLRARRLSRSKVRLTSVSELVSPKSCSVLNESIW